MSVGALVQRLLASVGVFGTMVALIISLKEPGKGFTLWAVVLITLFVTFGLMEIIFHIVDYRSSRPRIYKGDPAIRNYMYGWIRNGGSVEIFSRNLSWVNDDDMRSLLRAKAESGNLTLVIPNSIPLSVELAGAGATVLLYPHIGHVMKSRFTIINSGRSDTAVAIGRTEGDNHIVEEFRASSNDPAFYLAQDLAAVMRGFCASAPQE